MEKELTSQTDYAKEAMRFYRKNQKSQNTFVLSLGVNTIEMYLKAIVEQEMGYVPEDLQGHSMMVLCNAINKMNIPYFQIPYSFTKNCQLVQHYYTGARYFDKDRRSNNIFSDYDFNLVTRVVDEAEKLLREYEKAHEKYLVMKNIWTNYLSKRIYYETDKCDF